MRPQPPQLNDFPEGTEFFIKEFDLPLARHADGTWYNWFGGMPSEYDPAWLKQGSYWKADRFDEWRMLALAPIRLDVYGRRMQAEYDYRGWSLYYVGEDGKRRLAHDIQVPADVSDADLDQYLADLCHEWATEQSPGVRRLG